MTSLTHRLRMHVEAQTTEELLTRWQQLTDEKFRSDFQQDLLTVIESVLQNRPDFLRVS